jgi:transposase-like protein
LTLTRFDDVPANPQFVNRTLSFAKVFAAMAGRPTSYDVSFVRVARTMSLEGSKQAAIARALGVAAPTLHGWAKKHPDFQAALNAGNEATGEVIVALVKAAKGFRRKTVRVETTKRADGTKDVKTIEAVDYYPPNVAACLAWVKRHRPDIWGDAGAGTRTPADAPEGDVTIPTNILRMLALAAERKQATL